MYKTSSTYVPRKPLSTFPPLIPFLYLCNSRLYKQEERCIHKQFYEWVTVLQYQDLCLWKKYYFICLHVLFLTWRYCICDLDCLFYLFVIMYDINAPFYFIFDNDNAAIIATFEFASYESAATVAILNTYHIPFFLFTCIFPWSVF